MKKLISLFVALSASLSLFAEVTYDNAYWVIKDGRITDNVGYYPYDDLGSKVASEMADTTVNGIPMVVYRQLTGDYLDVRLTFNPNNLLDLSKNYIMVLEYKIPASHAGINLIEGNKPLFIFGFAQTETGLKTNNAVHSDVYSFIDAKWGKTDEWVTTFKYLYANPSITTLEGMIVSYAREYLVGDYNDPLVEYPYIMNLGFLSVTEGKPFYTENFDGYCLGEFYNEKIDVSNTNPKKHVDFQGGINPVVSEDDAEYFDDNGLSALTVFRDYLPDSIGDQDGSGYIDCEQLHALQVEGPLKYRDGGNNGYRDPIIFAGIQIPAGCDQIHSQMIIKKHKNEKNTWVDADPSEWADMDVPVKVRFNTGEEVDLADDRVKMIWTKFNGVVNVPGGATSFDLVFNAMPVGYLVDDIILSAKAFNNVNDFMAENNSFEIVAYVDANGDIVVVNGELVALYNMNGQLASEGDKVVVLLARNAEGKLSTKLMIRK